MSIRHEVRAATLALTDMLSERGLTLDVYTILAVYGVLDEHIPAPAPVEEQGVPNQYGQMEFSHDALVAKALSSRVVMEYVFLNKRLEAIKELRHLTLCGLKAAKEAIEDERVRQGEVPPE